ncbi:hypothetical protein CDL12_30361 [Handroanthus impetiginosus]|uniref:Translation initiation factor 3 N-terminal domain-containing protein n=1 Tax=Handroanthus impetiginosus TaxID=429701 RepID=A0A2G9FW64_9LAMI|nr:hypothetical protein CDL12_30361 [Handroanthus impetiginosus]
MVIWSRLRQSKLKFNLFANEFKKCYILNHGRTFAGQHIPPRTLISSLINPNYVVQSSQLEFFCRVRSYAAPVQVNQKKEEKDTSGPKLNEQITAPTVRLVSDEGHFVISRYDALARARTLKMDLVEVDRHAKPPVCKIMDYHKEKYIQQTKEKERAKSKATIKKGSCKEIRFAAKICTAIEPTDEVDLETLLSRFWALIEDIAIEESAPKVEKKQAYVVVRHIKFGPSKKGSGKKASKTTVSSETSNKNQPAEDNGDTIEAGSETEHAESEESSDEDVRTNKSNWAVFDRDDDIHTVFDINDETNGPTRSSKHEEPAIVNEPSSPPRQTMQNRYARDPRLVKPSRIPTDTSGRFARNTMNTVPQVPIQGKHPQFSIDRSPQTRPNQQYQGPAHDISKQNSNLPPKTYGISSAQQVNTTPHEQSAPAETNRYKRNPPIKRGPNVDNPGQGKWGIFSTDNSNKKNEGQTELHRR